MLVLTRKKDETVKAIFDKETLQKMLAQVEATGEPLTLETTLIKVKGNTVRLGIEAEKYIRVVRGEIAVETPVATETPDTPVEPAADGD